jgi:hypothetical protein
MNKTGLLVLGLWWLTPLSTIFQLYRGLLGVRIICPNGFSEHYKNPTQHIYLVHYYIIQKNLRLLVMVWLKNCSLGVKQQPLTHSNVVVC